MNQWVFVVLDCELRSETGKDFSWWLRLVEKDSPPCKDDSTDPNLLHPTLQTKSSFFVLKVENIMIELTIYIYTPYMLNTVNICSFLIFDFLLLLLPEAVHLLFYLPLVKKQKQNTIQRQHGWLQMQPCERTRRTVWSRKERSLEAVFRKWNEKGWGVFIFVFQQGCYDIVTQRCFKDKIHPKTLTLLHLNV